MRGLLRSRFTRLSALAIVGLCATVVLAALLDEDSNVEDLYDLGLHATLAARQATDLQDLTDRFLVDQHLYLWITPPEPDFILFQPAGLVPILDLEAFPDSFIDGLAGVIEEDGIRRFPIWVYEDGDSPGREIVIEGLEGKQIARIKREWGYSPDWFVRDHYPELDTYDKWHRDWLLACYEPTRICMRYDLLVGEDDLIKYVWRQSIDAALRPKKEEGGGMMKSSWQGGTVSNLQFVAIDKATNDTVELTIAWPAGGLSTNMVDFFACTDLTVQDWDIAVTTNVDLDTNCFSWIDWDATNYARRFYDCWTLHDSDGDGLSDGREVRLYGSETNNTDSDGDSIEDGTEVANRTDPTNPDTTNPVIVISFPASGCVKVWVP